MFHCRPRVGAAPRTRRRGAGGGGWACRGPGAGLPGPSRPVRPGASGPRTRGAPAFGRHLRSGPGPRGTELPGTCCVPRAAGSPAFARGRGDPALRSRGQPRMSVREEGSAGGRAPSTAKGHFWPVTETRSTARCALLTLQAPPPRRADTLGRGLGTWFPSPYPRGGGKGDALPSARCAQQVCDLNKHLVSEKNASLLTLLCSKNV